MRPRHQIARGAAAETGAALTLEETLADLSDKAGKIADQLRAAAAGAKGLMTKEDLLRRLQEI